MSLAHKLLLNLSMRARYLPTEYRQVQSYVSFHLLQQRNVKSHKSFFTNIIINMLRAISHSESSLLLHCSHLPYYARRFFTMIHFQCFGILFKLLNFELDRCALTFQKNLHEHQFHLNRQVVRNKNDMTVIFLTMIPALPKSGISKFVMADENWEWMNASFIADMTIMELFSY